MSNAALSKKRVDYKPSSHQISHVDLCFELSPQRTLVNNTMKIQQVDASASSLFLDGKNLQFVSAQINGQALEKSKDFEIQEQGILIHCALKEFELSIANIINPEQNTSLEGLYYSNDAFCTQCEAQGFRKITYFLDRPDILSIYTVSIVSKDESLTYLLSNGNLISDSGMQNGERTCVWQDPHPKPAYLFALVAGHFDKLDDHYTTQSGREVKLELFVDEGRLGQGQHALDSLKKAMQWDEQTYGLEYDLDIYMVVAVDFFNMGAMENKGLNVFNSKFVLANPNTATDTDYFNIESIIAHEYFHNWTGNRVTCRDWFQLSLKEGLTVFRDQQFSADMFSYLTTRISQVKVMQDHQFAEDASPMSHPIRPDEVMEMNNFYTVTVYDKGAEVIRMLHTLLGTNGFRQGMDLYFARHDGCAVTCDDFVNAMQDANDKDLSHFKLWYSQSGTPVIDVQQCVNSKGHTTLTFTQAHKATADQAHKKLLYIPIKLECFDADGNKIDTSLSNDTLVLTDAKHILDLGIQEGMVTPSLLQDFSAPVIVEYAYNAESLLKIMQYSTNDYAKWEACQRFFFHHFKHIYRHIVKNAGAKISDALFGIQESLSDMAQVLNKLSVSKAVFAQLLSMPTAEACMSQLESVDPLLALSVHDALSVAIAKSLSSICEDCYKQNNSDAKYSYKKSQINERALKSACLKLLATANHSGLSDIIETQYTTSDNMTDRLSALQAAQILSNFYEPDLFNKLMSSFEEQFKHDAVVMDKWFSMHATSRREDILSHLDLLQSHPQFSHKNPNKVRAVVGSFAFYNLAGFHQKNGLGYKYLTDYLLELDKVNPQVASRVITPLIQLSHYCDTNRKLMKTQLERLFAQPHLSKDLFEKISKSLASLEH